MSAIPVIFECPTCRQPVTRPLVPLPDDKSVCYEDGEAAIPPGFFALSDDDYWTGSTGCPLINLADLVDTQDHPDSRRNGGCCGRDGCNGPNLLCMQGHEIGTERSDCWMAHAAVLVRTMTRRVAAE